MKAISEEKREMIIEAKKRGEKPETIAVWVNVAVSSVYNIIALFNKTKSITPKPRPGKPGRLTPENLEKIRTTIEMKNDITLEELIEELDLPIKKSRLSKILIDMDLSFKKRRFIQKNSKEKMLNTSVSNGRKIKKT